MATIKSCTSLEQSKKLAKILRHESADMRYDEYVSYVDGTPKVGYKKGVTDGIPCWSLAALLNVLPHKLKIVLVINDYYKSNTVKDKYAIGSVDNNDYDCYADNPVDACYEIIVKLHEQNLL